MSSPARRRKWLRRGAIGAVVLVPLAFAGLFVGALSTADRATDRIPAAIVNQDQLVYTTAADGTRSPVFAGRQLVTELTGGTEGFDWTITNAADAKKALATGSVYAILTVPKNFSSSILSLPTSIPQPADLRIRTDDAHSYLTGAVAQAVGSGMVSTFGKAITARYISGIYSSIGDLGASLGQAASGAGSLSTGASDLSSGLSTLSSGAASAQTGAASLSSGVARYTTGVDGLSGGLGKLNAAAVGLSALSGGVAQYTGGITQLAQALARANTAVQNGVPVDCQGGSLSAAARISCLTGQLSAAAAGGASLSQQVSAGVSGIQGGIAHSTAGAAQLAAGSAGLRSGASSLAGSLGGLSSGASTASSGAGKLASGASDLASGLESGASRVPVADAHASAAAAQVAADPVRLRVSRANKISGIGQAIATFFVPLGLWIGALAVFLVMRPVTRRALASTAANSRLVFSALARASLVTGAQALLLVGLVHLVAGVGWAALPATLGFSVLMALAFTAFHYLLTVGMGRAGLVVSLFALAVQVASTGGLYPVQVLATPFQWVSPLLPLTYGVSGMQSIIAGGSAGPVLAGSAILLVFGIGSVLVSLLAIRRARALDRVPVGP